MPVFHTKLCANDADSTHQKRVFHVIPVIYYTSETRWVLEAFSYIMFNSKQSNKLSNVKFFINATQEKQFAFLVPFQIFSKKDRYLYMGRLEAMEYPEYFYGIGNNTKHLTREKYVLSLFSIQVKALRQVEKQFFFGFNSMVRYLQTDLLEVCSTFNDKSGIIGLGGYKGCSLGPSLVYDSRDHILNSSKGVYADFSLSASAGKEIFGNPYSYVSIATDFRYFTPLSKRHVFATHLALECMEGKVPYRDLGVLGGPKNLRGYFYGRFRDKNLGLVDAELRSHIAGRFGAVVFGGAGSVASSFNDIFSNTWHLSYGVGLRFKLNKNDKANVRADFAFGKDSRSINLLLAEAF